MKKTLLIALLLFTGLIYSQDFTVLDKIYQVEVSYRLSKLASSKNNDNYLIEFKYINTSESDIYYRGIPQQNKKSEVIHEFAKINIPNATKISRDIALYFFGDATATSTLNNATFIIRSKKEYQTKTELKTEIGIVPEINLVKVLNFEKETAQLKPAHKKITLSEGIIIKAALTKSINGSQLSIGDKLDFELSEDIIVDNYTIVKRGAKILGTVTDAKGSRMLGKKGKLAFTIDYLYLPNGKVLKLRNQTTKQLQGSGVTVAATAILLTPFALFINGKNAKYERGTTFDTYLDETVEL